jgi:PAS domain S-box-containing protein
VDFLLERVDILIVDDRLDGLIALEAVLSSPRMNLVRAQSGREAISLITQHNFAVILLDVQMPELDGFETALIIRQNEKYRFTPIIFVTAINKDDKYIYKGYEAGAVDYIFKPFEPQILRSKVGFFVDLFLKSKQLQAQADMIRESERRERYLKLAELEVESLKRYRNLADSIPHLIWKARVDGSLDYFNKVWTDYTGLSQEQSAGSGWQSAIHIDDLSDFLKTWLHSMTSRQPFEIECRIRKSTGEMRWHWVRAVPEMRRNEEVVAWLGSCTDIHDRKITEMKLMEAEKVAVSASVAKTNFLANMSHEIRTPLSAILGFAELMTNPAQSEDEHAHCISTIRRSGRQLLEIIDEILDISKVEAGHLEIEKIEVDIGALITELRSLMEIQAKNLLRSDSLAPDSYEPDWQRPEIYLQGQSHGQHRLASGKSRPIRAPAVQNFGHRGRHRNAASASFVSALHSSRQFHDAKIWRHRPRLGTFSSAGKSFGRRGCFRAQRTGQRQHLPSGSRSFECG